MNHLKAKGEKREGERIREKESLASEVCVYIKQNVHVME